MDGPQPEHGPVRFRPHVCVEQHDDTLVVLEEDGLSTVRYPEAVAVATMIDGRRDLAQIEAAAPVGIPPWVVRKVVERLRDLGVVEPAVADGPPAAPAAPRVRAFRDATGARRDGAPAPVVEVVDLGDAQAHDAVVAALGASGAVLAAPGAAADLGVVLVNDYLDPRLADLDEQLRGRGRPWLLVRAGGVRQWIGPFFGAAPDGPCWHCLGERLWGHRQAEAALQARRGRLGPLERPLPALASTVGLAAHATALEVDSWAAGLDRAVTRGVWVFDARTMSGTLHELRRRPQCATCGDPGLMARHGARPVVLGTGPFDTGADEDPASRFAHLVSPVTGLIPSLEVRPGPVPGTHVARTGPTPSSRVRPFALVRHSARTANGGAAPSAAAAGSSAVCEALERFSSQYGGDEHRVRTRRRHLGDEAVDPADCLLFDARQYRDRREWNAAHGSFNRIGPPVVDEPTLWSPLWSLRDGCRRWLPTAMLFAGAPGPPWARYDSNGCAAGPTRDAAVQRGLLELVERDAVALWWYNRTVQPGVDLTDDPAAAGAVAGHRAAGRELWALDLTTDLGVPTVAAVSGRRRPDGTTDRVMVGFAADLDPAAALRRAVDELAQTTVLVTPGGDTAFLSDPDARRWTEQVGTGTERWLLPGSTTPLRALGGPAALDPGAGAAGLAARLVEHGLEPLVVDQTRPDVGLPVVKTVVPGLRPMWARFAPGRLFDVPVSLGRLDGPTPYADLNPLPVFL